MQTEKEFWVVTGPTGAGKTAFVPNIQERFAARGGIDYVCPDLEGQDFEKAVLRVYDHQIPALRDAGRNILLETTIPDPQLIADMRKHGYRTNVVAIGVATEDIAKANIRDRVAQGGHNISDPSVATTFQSCKIHTPRVLTIADAGYIYDNSGRDFRLVASRDDDTGFVMHVLPRSLFTGQNSYIKDIVHELGATRQLAPSRSLMQQAWLQTYTPK